MLILFGFLFIADSCRALCNISVNIATLILFNIVMYMPDPLCSCYECVREFIIQIGALSFIN